MLERYDRSWPPAGYDPNRGSGYRLTPEEFSRLTSDAKYRPFIAPMIRRWFGVEMVNLETGTTFRTADGSIVPAGIVHASVQGDPKKQYELYQFAMSWWR